MHTLHGQFSMTKENAAQARWGAINLIRKNIGKELPNQDLQELFYELGLDILATDQPDGSYSGVIAIYDDADEELAIQALEELSRFFEDESYIEAVYMNNLLRFEFDKTGFRKMIPHEIKWRIIGD